MTPAEFRKKILAKMAYTHGIESYYYYKIRDKMIKFSDTVVNDLIRRYVDENDNVDYIRAIRSIRDRRRLR